MNDPKSIDGVLVTWGDRLFFPSNRIVKSPPPPHLKDRTAARAAVLRQRIAATVARRAPQVMVKVTGGGRGMRGIVAHLNYISKRGRLEIEDELGHAISGKDAVNDLADQWRVGGSRIDEVSDRREAFNIMLSMPSGTNAHAVMQAAREFAQAELADHFYVMVLHEHQANPHVHLSVRAESKHGVRLNPRKADLHRWRETFAEKLRGCGIDAEATRQATRGQARNFDPLWQVKAKAEGRLQTSRTRVKTGARARLTRLEATEVWRHLATALADSTEPGDRKLASAIDRFVRDATAVRRVGYPTRDVADAMQEIDARPQLDPSRSR